MTSDPRLTDDVIAFQLEKAGSALQQEVDNPSRESVVKALQHLFIAYMGLTGKPPKWAAPLRMVAGGPPGEVNR